MREQEPTQRTDRGLGIPVPTRGQIDDALAKLAQPQKPAGKRKRRPRKT